MVALSMVGVRYITVCDHKGQRLDNYLLRELKAVPKSRIYSMIRKGEVRVNSKRISPKYRLAKDDRVRIPPVTSSENLTGPIPVSAITALRNSVIFEDERLLVIDKPTGYAVHRGGTLKYGIIDALLCLYPGQKLSLAHRLDQATSGCLLIAKTVEETSYLHSIFRSNSVRKIYDAIVVGNWERKSRVVSKPLKRYMTKDGQRFARTSINGAYSRTEFVLVAEGKAASWVRAVPTTGRTHQIRVHAHSVGHPIIGDVKYNPNKHLKASRLMLHASEVKLPDGRSFKSNVPVEFDGFWATVEGD